MAIFYGVLFMLGAILLSNIINRVLPAFSVPIVQIFLGVILSLIPWMYHFSMEPQLFLILFLAPLLFYDSMQCDKKTLWHLKKPIILLGLGLVVFSVVILGYLIHRVIPAIPLAASFALAAALAPTDAVAVGSIGKRIKIPNTITGLLGGEALINDASGIVSFQFAIIAMLTGSFSVFQAGMDFLYMAIGGIVLGAILTGAKYLLVKWVRDFGMEGVTFHLLIEILTPFLIYMIAEEVGVSGILAVVISGVIHSIESRRIDPEIATLKISSKSIWSTIAFILNGLVFLILGMQFPLIIKTIWFEGSVNIYMLIAYIFVITIGMIFIRFLWTYLILDRNKKVFSTNRRQKLSESLIISLAGVRGSVTLATCLSLPFVLADGSSFIQRDLIIFLASGVILLSMLSANFLLPLLIKREDVTDTDENENKAYLEIMELVLKQLESVITDENRYDLSNIRMNYLLRAEQLRNHGINQKHLEDEEKSLKQLVLQWEEESTRKLVDQKEISKEAAERYIARLKQMNNRGRNRRVNKGLIKHIVLFAKQRNQNQEQRDMFEKERHQFMELKRKNNEYVLQQLYDRKSRDGSIIIDRRIAEQEQMKILLKERMILPRNHILSQKEITSDNSQSLNSGNELRDENTYGMIDLISICFQIERDCIQSMFEQNRITREMARKFRNNVALMELQLKNNEE